MGSNGKRDPVVDAAQYLIESPDLWISGVPSKLADAAPRVVSLPDGGEAWSFESGAWLRPLGLEVEAGRGPIDVRGSGHSYSDIREGMYQPVARLADMAIDEVDAACVFPTYGQDLRYLRDRALQVACVRAYNDAAWAWARAAGGDRLIPQALVPAVGLDEAVTELERVAAMGYRGIVFCGFPAMGDKPQPEEDRFWAVCNEAGLVVNLVAGGPLAGDLVPAAPARYVGPNGRARAVDIPIEVAWTQQATSKNVNLSWLVLTGVLERFPSLQLVMVDTAAGWLPTCGELLDWNYRYAQFIAFAKLRYRPSDYIKRQVKATIRSERRAVEARRDVGTSAMMWSSGYPQSSSTWPSSPHALDSLFSGVPAADRAAMQGGNCAALYRIATAEKATTGPAASRRN
ncbi:MAG TPA: amidohydrolase family protein [Acidimicrobiales bacterium]|nr:amidohydrolase family protein [Acidimicrobiales bacterium]